MTAGRFIEPQSHEADIHFIFAEDGLDPYYALNAVIRKEHDDWQTEGKPKTTMEFRGETWALVADYDQQPIDPWSHESYRMESAPLFRIYFAAKDALYDGKPADQSGKVRGGTMTIRPRWPNMTKDGGTPVRGVPDLGKPYIDVQVQASNIEHSCYPELVRTAMAAFDVSHRYFENPHEMSNINDLARYVRVRRSKSSPLYAADGPIARTHAVLEAGQEGYRKHVEDHTKVPGYHVSTIVDDKRARDIIPGQQLGKEIKHYYPRDPSYYEPGDALYHPKLEVAYQTARTDETLRWSDLDEAVRELDEAIYNYLDWADLPVRADEETFRSDEYFDASAESHRSVKLVDCPLPDVEDEQEHVVMRLWGNTLESDRDLIDSLVTDGGKPTREELANRTGYSYRTVRRFVNRCEDVVRDAYDGLSIDSKHKEQLLIDRVRTAESQFRESVEHAVLNAADVVENRGRSKWSEVKQRYNVSLSDGKTKQVLDVGYRPEDREDLADVIRSIRLAARERFRSIRRFALEVTTIDGEHRRIPNLESWRPGAAKTTREISKPDWVDDAEQLADERYGRALDDLADARRRKVIDEVTE
ncbi:DUF7845 domain-containing protein [Halobellus limi]|uniref:Winged helix-turn-helix domain-containing protein n=1 Tax=Halobellus limi TaxID=699433 RepID=A0A1H5VWZ8_9EURY|nr:winged helix-turn-helix domain-containing protein [Halobellus limi]QCC46596.1 winged helix-turn-helix domain-containing protein [Halobellus limi]SEF91653.1 hypothetical protein SAMN04488133_1095 [Halobellus limi]